MPSSPEYMRAWEAKNRVRRNAYHRERGFSRDVRIPLDEVVLLVTLQGGKCAMPDCSLTVAATDPKSHVDHTHDDLSLIRGVLCIRCNTKLGQYEANRSRAAAFDAYLGA